MNDEIVNLSLEL